MFMDTVIRKLADKSLKGEKEMQYQAGMDVGVWSLWNKNRGRTIKSCRERLRVICACRWACKWGDVYGCLEAWAAGSSVLYGLRVFIWIEWLWAKYFRYFCHSHEQKQDRFVWTHLPRVNVITQMNIQAPHDLPYKWISARDKNMPVHKELLSVSWECKWISILQRTKCTHCFGQQPQLSANINQNVIYLKYRTKLLQLGWNRVY